MSSTEYTLWNGNGENRLVNGTASLILATSGVFFSYNKWPPRPGFAPWAYLNSTIRARLMVSSRTPNSPVAIWVITWSLYGMSMSGYPPSPVQVKVFHSRAAMALASIVLLLTEPNDMPPP